LTASLKCAVPSAKCGLSVKPEMPSGVKANTPRTNRDESALYGWRGAIAALSECLPICRGSVQVSWVGTRRLLPSDSKHSARCRTGPGSNAHRLDASSELGDLPHSHTGCSHSAGGVPPNPEFLVGTRSVPARQPRQERQSCSRNGNLIGPFRITPQSGHVLLELGQDQSHHAGPDIGKQPGCGLC
jgi:hypothetical protein